MNKYTHRISIDDNDVEQWSQTLGISFEEWLQLFEDYYSCGYLYGYLADNILLGNLVESNSEYVCFEYWFNVRDREVERLDNL